MAAAMIRSGVSSRAQLMGMAGEGAPGHRNYTAWARGLYWKLRQAATVFSQGDLVRESTESLILDRRKKIGTHNLRHIWIVAGLAMSGYSFGIWTGPVFTKFEKQTLGAAKERWELWKKLGRQE